MVNHKIVYLLLLTLLNILNDVLTLSLTKQTGLQKEIYDLNNAYELFTKFINDYNKKYEAHEFEFRLQVFKDNLKKLNELNKVPSGVVYKINSFADMKSDEFKKTHTGLRNNCTRSKAVVSRDVVDFKPKLSSLRAPRNLDWREQGLVTRVKNQGLCGSCFSFSAIGNIEGQYAKKYGQLISLSDQQGLDCQSRGCGGGYILEVIHALAHMGGAVREQDYPYEAAKGPCRVNYHNIAVKVTGGGRIAVSDEEELKYALAEIGPLAIAIHTSDNFHYYQGGIMTIQDCPDYTVDHAVLLVGYGEENGIPYWLIKNSWDSEWGEDGYVRLERGQSVCNIGTEVYTATIF